MSAMFASVRIVLDLGHPSGHELVPAEVDAAVAALVAAPPAAHRDAPVVVPPALPVSGSVSERSGPFRVISDPSTTERNRVPGVIGLNFLIAMISSTHFVEFDVIAFGEADHRLLEGRAPPDRLAGGAHPSHQGAPRLPLVRAVRTSSTTTSQASPRPVGDLRLFASGWTMKV
jgi:hypothetical protein